jgi:hypothetical protein
MEGNGSKKAIVIGISDYDLLQPLDFCKADGVKMHELLRSIGYEIQENHKLIGRVKREEMREAIIDFFAIGMLSLEIHYCFIILVMVFWTLLVTTI